MLEIGRIVPQRILDEDSLTGIHKVFSVSGCCLCINTELFTEINAFDENTFLYNEENILGSMISKTDYSMYIDLDSVVIHNHGASSGAMNTFVKKELIKSTLYYWKTYRNTGRVICKSILYIFCLKSAFQKLKYKEIDYRVIFAEGKQYYRQLWRP